MDQAHKERLRGLELATLRQTGHTLTVALLCTMLFIVWLIHAAVPRTTLYLWCLALMCFLVLRAWLVGHFLRELDRDSEASIRRWRRNVYFSSVCTGLLLGSLAWLAMPALDVAHRLALTFVVVLLCQAAISHSYAFLPALVLLRVLALLPFAAAWWLLPSDLRALALVLALTPFLGVYIGRNNHRVMRQSWELVVKNETLAAELLQGNEKLRELGNSRNRLFAMAGHDLRQPVHAMGLAIAQLRQDAPREEFEQHLRQLRESSYLVADMLQDLMDISNLERDDFAVNKEPVALADLVRQLRLSLESVARAKGLRLETTVASPSLAVRSDAALLRRILMNLVTNAIKYTPAGTVGVHCAADDDGEVVIRVRDTGVGIAPEHLADIFQDYMRVGGTRRKDEGQGLGLSVVRRAAERLGHSVSVTSTVGQGSVFEVRAERAELPEAPASPSVRLPDEARRDEVVLVVEDDEYLRGALGGMLAQWGFVPQAAATAQEALDSLGPLQRPAMIIADMQLSPDEDGFDAIARARLHVGNGRLPALLMTGDVNPALIPRAAAQGITVAHKPMPPPLLRQKIQALLQAG